MSELIVLTCASGKQSAHIIPALIQKEHAFRLRLVVNSESSATRLRTQYPNAEVLQADLNNIAECYKILEGASTIVHINPSFHPRETQIGMNVVDAAIAESSKSESRFQHFIFSSVLNTQFSKMLNHDRKKYVEEYLMESDLKWTILQPGHFADTALGGLMRQRNTAKPVHMAGFDPSIPFSFLALKDLGEVTVKIITERQKHFYGMYPLVSFGPIPYTEFVESVGEQIGKEIEIRQVPLPVAVDKLCEVLFGTSDLDKTRKDAPERMLLFYNKRGLIGNSNVLTWLLGRQPTGLKDLMKSASEKAESV